MDGRMTLDHLNKWQDERVAAASMRVEVAKILSVVLASPRSWSKTLPPGPRAARPLRNSRNKGSVARSTMGRSTHQRFSGTPSAGEPGPARRASAAASASSEKHRLKKSQVASMCGLCS